MYEYSAQPRFSRQRPSASQHCEFHGASERVERILLRVGVPSGANSPNSPSPFQISSLCGNMVGTSADYENFFNLLRVASTFWFLHSLWLSSHLTIGLWTTNPHLLCSFCKVSRQQLNWSKLTIQASSGSLFKNSEPLWKPSGHR